MNLLDELFHNCDCEDVFKLLIIFAHMINEHKEFIDSRAFYHEKHERNCSIYGILLIKYIDFNTINTGQRTTGF